MGLKAVGSTPSGAAPPPGGEAFPVGSVFFSAVSTNPATMLGYGTWSALAAGKFIATFDNADANFNVGLATGGANAVTVTGDVTRPILTMDSYTPTGNISTPTFTGSVANTSAVSAGTPAGTNNIPVFTANVANTSAVTGGTPAGTLNAPVFTGAALGTHFHELPLIIQSNTVVRVLAQSVFGSGANRASAANFNTAGSTTAGNVAISQACSGGTPAGTVSVPIFTGSALATHNHNVTVTGTITAPVFTGSALGTHNHNMTATGSISTPTFTGDARVLTGNVNQPVFTANAAVILNPYLVLYAWRRTA